MNASDLLPLLNVRAPNMMWLLGAGASAAAGIPTAYDMTWDFKRTLYCAEQRVSLATCNDLGNAVVLARIQEHLDASGSHPARDADDEYAHYFEAVYPDPLDRRRYIEHAQSGAAFSFGHRILAALLSADRSRIVWTTNFDRMVEDAVANVAKTTGSLKVATLDTPHIAAEWQRDGRGPLLVKLHGDFQSERLKNIEHELRGQDASLRTALVESCRRWGLVVVGYSGRDSSILDALGQAVADGNGFPLGLFWVQRGSDPALPMVQELIDRARSQGIEAAIVNDAGTFDELMGDVLLLDDRIDPAVRAALEKARPQPVSNARLTPPEGGFPVVRLNALPVTEWPTSARLIKCGIGGMAEVRKAIETVDARVLAGRRNAGVIAFGEDSEMRRAFGPAGIEALDVFPIEPRRLVYWDSAEIGLLCDAIGEALCRDRPLRFIRSRRRRMLACDPASDSDGLLMPLQTLFGATNGKLRDSGRRWADAVSIRLDYRFDALWLLLEPTVWVDSSTSVEQRFEAQEFVRSRLAGRFNRKWNDALDHWRLLLLGGDAPRTASALAVSDGIDATFTVGHVTAFSQRRNS